MYRNRTASVPPNHTQPASPFPELALLYHIPPFQRRLLPGLTATAGPELVKWEGVGLHEYRFLGDSNHAMVPAYFNNFVCSATSR